jgi:hypothetical protein
MDDNKTDDSLETCGSPACSVTFPRSGLAIKPKRYCSERCRTDAFIIRKVAGLYRITVEELHEVLSNGFRRGRQ